MESALCVINHRGDLEWMAGFCLIDRIGMLGVCVACAVGPLYYRRFSVIANYDIIGGNFGTNPPLHIRNGFRDTVFVAAEVTFLIWRFD